MRTTAMRKQNLTKQKEFEKIIDKLQKEVEAATKQFQQTEKQRNQLSRKHPINSVNFREKTLEMSWLRKTKTL